MTDTNSGKKTQIVAAICCASSVLLCFNMLVPLLAEIQKSFPQASASRVQMVYTVVSLVALPVMLLAGDATRLLSKKALTAIGLSVLLAGGLLPTVLHGRLWMLYLSGALVGGGMAVVNVLSSALISDHFQGVDKGRIMGIQSAALSLGGAVFSVCSGRIAEMSTWRWSFLLYLLVIPLLLVFLRWMPADRRTQTRPPAARIYSRRLLGMTGLGVVWNIFLTGFQTNVAMFMVETGYGGAELSGVTSAIFMLIGIPVGFAMGGLIRALQRYIAAVAVLCGGLGMLLIGLSWGVAPVLLGAFLLGVAFSVYCPATITAAAAMVPPESAAAGIALLNAVGSLGKFASPYVLNFFASLTGGSFRGVFLISGGGLLLLGAVYLLVNPIRKQDLC